jgi:endonuclease IV
VTVLSGRPGDLEEVVGAKDARTAPQLGTVRADAARAQATVTQRHEAIARGNIGDETLTDFAHSYNVNHSAIGRF